MYTALPRLRVLVVEDEWLIASQLENILIDGGCEVIGPIPSVAAALRQVQDDGFDVAILDVNLQGEVIWPVVDVLIDRQVPFLLATGYSRTDLQPCYRQLPICHKPYMSMQVLAALSRAWDHRGPDRRS